MKRLWSVLFRRDAGVALRGVGHCTWWMGVIAWLGALWFAPGVVDAAVSEHETVKGKQSLRVLTYNLFFKTTNWASVVKVLEKADADVVALQEVTPGAETVLRDQLGGRYPQMDFRHAPGSAGLAMLSRVPWREVRYVGGVGKSGRGFQWVEVKPEGWPWVRMVNIHLPTPRVNQMKSVGGVIDVFEKAGEAQEREITRIWKETQGDGDGAAVPGVILGDFNSFSFGPAQRFLKDKGWVDSFGAVVPEADRHPTWEWRERGGHRYRLDYVFHSVGMRTISSRVLEEGESDHFAVQSVLEWRGGGE